MADIEKQDPGSDQLLHAIEKIQDWLSPREDMIRSVVSPVARAFGFLTVGRVTILAAVAITLLSAVRLSAVSYGNATTARAILYNTGVTELPLSVLLTILPWLGAIILVFSVAGFAFLPKEIRMAGLAWIFLLCVVASAVTPLWVYIGVLLLWLVVKLVSMWKRRKRRRPEALAPEGYRQGAASMSKAQALTDWLGRINIAVFVWPVLLLVFVSLALLTVRTTDMWLPPQRIQLRQGQEFTGYVLGQVGSGVEVLLDRTRIVKTIPDAQIIDITICSEGTQEFYGLPFLSHRIRRELVLSPIAAFNTTTAPTYPRCPAS